MCDLVGLCSLLSLHAAVILGALEERWWSISCEPGWRGCPSRALPAALGLVVLPDPGLGGAAPISLQLPGLSLHLCSLSPWRQGGTSATLCVPIPACPSLWHCHGRGRGKCILPLPQGQSGKLVLSYWALLAPPPPWTSLARLGQGKGPCWAHSGLVSMTTPGWPGVGGAVDGAEGQLGWRSAPPGSVASEARCPYVGNGPVGWRQAAHLLCRLGLGREEGFTVYILLL